MPLTKYEYSISADFPGGAVTLWQLGLEISESSIATALNHFVQAGDTLEIWFADALTAGEKTTLDGDTTGPAGGLLAAHGAVPRYQFKASAKLFSGVKSVTSDPTFEEVEGVATNIGFFSPDLTKALGQATLLVKTSGTGAELKLVETLPDGSSPVDVSAVFSVPDTAGAWQMVEFSTNVTPRSGGHLYSLHGRLNGATSMDLKAATLLLLREIG